MQLDLFGADEAAQGRRDRLHWRRKLTDLQVQLDTEPARLREAYKQPERRERALRDLMRKNKHPVVLIVNEAHGLHHRTLTGFKRLMELAAGAGVVLSVLLIGDPKLRNDLRRPQMEEIGYRTTTFEFEGVSSHRREFIAWLLNACVEDGINPAGVMDADAIDLSVDRPIRPIDENPPTG